MSDEQDKLKASLEPPRLFGRKKKSGPKGAAKPARATSRTEAENAEPTPVAEAEPAPEVSPEPAEPERTASEAEHQTAEPESVVPEVEENAAAGTAPEPVSAADEAAPEPTVVAADDPVATDSDDTQVIESEPEREAEAPPVPEDEAAPEPAPEPTPEPETTAVIEAEPDEAAEPDETAATPDSDDSSAAAPAQPEVPRGPSTAARLADRVRSRWGPKPGPTGAGEDESHEPARPAHGQIEVEPEPVSETEAEDAEIAARGTPYTEPMLDHYPAAALTGTLVGLAMVTLTWLSLRGCEALRGTATCGGGPGLLLLLAVFVVSVMLGNAILKSFLVPDPGSSSFLAVGLVAVVALLLLIDALDSWVMLIAIPLISIAAYLLSVYVTKTFVEPADR